MVDVDAEKRSCLEFSWLSAFLYGVHVGVCFVVNSGSRCYLLVEIHLTPLFRILQTVWLWPRA